METNKLLRYLRDKSHKQEHVYLRQALCYHLGHNNIPFKVVGQALGVTYRYVYDMFYNVHDRIRRHNKMMADALAEIESHDVMVRPKFETIGLFMKFNGYEVTIDNEIL